MTNVRIYPAQGKWVVRANGAVIGESTTALEVIQRELPFVIYFPRADIASVVLDQSDRPLFCDDRGEGIHYHVSSPEGLIENAGHEVTKPTPEAEALRDHIAFDAGKVTVERV